MKLSSSLLSVLHGALLYSPWCRSVSRAVYLRSTHKNHRNIDYSGLEETHKEH